MRSLPPAYIYAFPKYDPLHCATIKKTTPTTLECHKMTLTSDLDDYFPSSSGSETSEYDITSDEEDSDCDYSLKDARRWVQLDTKNLQKRRRRKRYYITIFRHLLDMAIWNAFILRKKKLPNIDNYDFRMNLVEPILEKFHVTTPRSAKRQKLQSDYPLRLTGDTFRT
ncbi:uncharacterized protein NPIL_113721 [Nephila pilipes]|uniref:PiggyBac transposable element-derived protein domain-containing protein n=1 Tax=Nephila pilipes TaxID=299642 RepID=A0A8X6UBP3_NEPPI|nr:uncharacterized protein NPIL_113721 [Nephila pilipes]